MTFTRFYQNHLQNVDQPTCVFRILAKGSKPYLEKEDVSRLVESVLENHKALTNIRNTDFGPTYGESRYVDVSTKGLSHSLNNLVTVRTVVARIFYALNSRADGKIPLKEFRRSSFVRSLFALQERQDIYIVSEHSWLCFWWVVVTNNLNTSSGCRTIVSSPMSTFMSSTPSSGLWIETMTRRSIQTIWQNM